LVRHTCDRHRYPCFRQGYGRLGTPEYLTEEALRVAANAVALNQSRCLILARRVHGHTRIAEFYMAFRADNLRLLSNRSRRAYMIEAISNRSLSLYHLEANLQVNEILR
jgi:hypothetical protein